MFNHSFIPNGPHDARNHHVFEKKQHISEHISLPPILILTVPVTVPWVAGPPSRGGCPCRPWPSRTRAASAGSPALAR